MEVSDMEQHKKEAHKNEKASEKCSICNMEVSNMEEHKKEAHPEQA